MKGGDIYYNVFARCLHVDLDARRYAEIFHCAVLCMAQNPLATDHNIYGKYFEREAVRLGMGIESRRAASATMVAIYNEPCGILKAISFYLPAGTKVQNAHIETYDNLLNIVPELWLKLPFAGGREMTTITTYVMDDIVKEVSRLHGGHN